METTIAIAAETTTATSNVINEGQVDKYTQLINTYGASAVIIAVFLVILLAVIAYLLHTNKKTQEQLIKQQQDMVNMIMGMAQEHSKREEENTKPKIIREPNLVELFLRINGTIKDTLKAISDDLEADRTSVYVFHNGVFSSHGLPFFKISCVCEIVKKGSGVTKNLKNHSGMPLQMFDNTISCIYKDGSMTVIDSTDDTSDIIQSSPVLCGMLKNNNVKSATGVAIYDHDSNIMGILMVEYSEVKENTFLEECKKSLIGKAPLLAPVLEYSGIYDSNNNN